MILDIIHWEFEQFLEKSRANAQSYLYEIIKDWF